MKSRGSRTAATQSAVPAQAYSAIASAQVSGLHAHGTQVRAQIETKAKSTSGVNNISAKELQELDVRICCIEEQAETVRILDAGLDAADTLDHEIDASLARAEALRQAILNMAFCGKLVPQDPNDEPAQALLDRIRAGRDGGFERQAPRASVTTRPPHDSAMTSALPINIDNLLHQRTIESERVVQGRMEPAGRPPRARSVCQRLHNLGGGYIVLGVEDQNGRPVLPTKGLHANAIDGTQKELLNLGNSAIQPPYHPLTAVQEVDGRTVLVLYAPGGETRPYRTRISLSASRSRDWAYYTTALGFACGCRCIRRSQPTSRAVNSIPNKITYWK